ncbi:hypothetical protein GCM10023200_04510 [Actinomycetospora chlora]|uniref:Uncharacterized protein n=1 Tax=Actinomycetospora chlora TaxID=663608 RepID=A0ABP9A716_9PSEU
MPSSVVFAALVLAWLVVLVPVVARRRQMVPRPAEADLSARVLPRTVGAPLMEEVAVATAQTQGRAGGAAVGAVGGSAGTTLAERADETPEAVDAELDLDAERADLDDLDDLDGDLDDVDDRADTDALTDEQLAPDARRPVGRERVLARPAPRGEEDLEDGLDDEYEDEFDDEAYDEYDDEAYDDLDEDLDDEPAGRELRPYRPGRGGFDPDAAAAAAHARYAFRQRIALGLIAVAVLSALAALVISSAMWWLHVAADVVLVGYLVFLRRQTRIEEEVRARRAARLSGERRALEARRARQAEHDARMAAHRDWIEAEYDADDDPAEAYEEEDDAPRWAAPRTPPPPVPADLELVDDSDDDPAFHDLDGERTYGYRRAAGA